MWKLLTYHQNLGGLLLCAKKAAHAASIKVYFLMGRTLDFHHQFKFYFIFLPTSDRQLIHRTELSIPAIFWWKSKDRSTPPKLWSSWRTFLFGCNKVLIGNYCSSFGLWHVAVTFKLLRLISICFASQSKPSAKPSQDVAQLG